MVLNDSLHIHFCPVTFLVTIMQGPSNSLAKHFRPNRYWSKSVYFNGPNLMLKFVQESAGHPVYFLLCDNHYSNISIIIFYRYSKIWTLLFIFRHDFMNKNKLAVKPAQHITFSAPCLTLSSYWYGFVTLQYLEFWRLGWGRKMNHFSSVKIIFWGSMFLSQIQLQNTRRCCSWSSLFS